MTPMKNNVRKLFVLLSALLAPGFSFASGGSTSGEVLTLGPGARAAAMGNAQAALANEAFALHWNPAGLGDLQSSEVALMHNQWFGDVRQENVAGAFPLRLGTLAFGYTRLGVDDIEAFDDAGNPGSSLKSESSVLSLGLGRELTASGNVLGGVAVKRFSEKDAGASSGGGWALDAGLLLPPAGERWAWLRRMSFGLTVRNLGPAAAIGNSKSPLPREIVAGTGFSSLMGLNVLSLGADVTRTQGGDTVLGLGGEFNLRDLFAFRLGYLPSDNQGGGLRFGAGLLLSAFHLDYAWSGFGQDLGPAHRISLSYRFNRTER